MAENEHSGVRRFLNEWLLPIAMVVGTAVYLLLANVDFFAPARHTILEIVEILMPVAIFLMLFFTFCKINPHDMKPRPWHAATLLLQTVLTLACAFVIVRLLRPASPAELVAEGVLACLVSPTAAAAAVVTGKLGGSAASLTTYTIESNVLSAVLIPIICPLIHPTAGMHILTAIALVLVRVSSMLVLPFVLAMLIRRVWPRIHAWLAALKDVAFYIWGISLTMVTGMTMRVVFAHLDRPLLVVALALGALAVCAFKFTAGKLIGAATGRVDSITAGQALGQKNTNFTIWMALTYLSPIAAVAPGAYVIWQNIVNSWELWEMERSQKPAKGN